VQRDTKKELTTLQDILEERVEREARELEEKKFSSAQLEEIIGTYDEFRLKQSEEHKKLQAEEERIK